MPTRITSTELARNLSDILNRARYKGEHFIIERNGETIATLGPATKPITWREFVEWWVNNRPDDKFADDLEAIHAEMNQPLPEPPEWPS
jgi:antitoxin (DNA-binding transcriptional repressor) of toxin-antitoxin stability system